MGAEIWEEAQVAPLVRCLFGCSLPEWKVSSAVVKIPSKGKKPVPVSPEGLMGEYFICGWQVSAWTGGGGSGIFHSFFSGFGSRSDENWKPACPSCTNAN